MTPERREQLLRLFKKYQYFLLVLAVGVALLAFQFPTKKDAGGQEKEQTGQATAFDLEEFEKQVQRSLSKIDGAGRVEVVLSLESSERNIYASDINQSSQNSGTDSASRDYESRISIVSDGSYGESPVLIRTDYPEFRGALVLCDGADNNTVRLQLTQAVSALCGLSSDRISIIKME